MFCPVIGIPQEAYDGARNRGDVKMTFETEGYSGENVDDNQLIHIDPVSTSALAFASREGRPPFLGQQMDLTVGAF